MSVGPIKNTDDLDGMVEEKEPMLPHEFSNPNHDNTNHFNYVNTPNSNTNNISCGATDRYGSAKEGLFLTKFVEKTKTEKIVYQNGILKRTIKTTSKFTPFYESASNVVESDDNGSDD